MNPGHPVYTELVFDELARGKGVACFSVLMPDGHPVVLFAAHKFTPAALEKALHRSGTVRAAHAFAIQRDARRQAAAAGFEIVVP